MNRAEIANSLAVSVFVTLFFSGFASIYIAHAVQESQTLSSAAAAAANSVATGTPDVVIMNTTSKPGNIAAATFFSIGAVLGLLVVIMLALQLKKVAA